MGKRYALVVVLGYSRLLWLRFFERQDMRTLFRGLEEAFAFFGSVPREMLFDQMKAVITKDLRLMGGQLVINEEFLRFAAHWGFTARACRPYRAQTKGKVERPIHYIRDNLAESGEYSEKWLTNSKTYLDRAVDFFTQHQHASDADADADAEPDPDPRPRNLASISAQDVHAYTRWLKDQPNNRGGTHGKQTIRHHLHALSNVFKRAISEGKLSMGHNPVAAMMDKPTVPLSTTRLLEVEELTLLLESARTLPRGGAGGASVCFVPMSSSPRSR